MSTIACLQDVMQVCANGHVVTDLLRTCPERGLSHCDRCGAATLDHCATCGQELPGAIPVPGMVPIGGRRPPQYCPACGARFPWTEKLVPPPPNSLALLENLLRRLPRTIRQLRIRHGDRPPFRVEDEYDLEDLLRALLPLYFDIVYPESRTPTYVPGTRTDFVLGTRTIALTVKRATPALRERQLAEQFQEDVAYYRRHSQCRTFVGFVYDPEGLLPEPRRLEVAWSKSEDELDVRCTVAG